MPAMAGSLRIRLMGKVELTGVTEFLGWLRTVLPPTSYLSPVELSVLPV
jgi:hypothetical protein